MTRHVPGSAAALVALLLAIPTAPADAYVTVPVDVTPSIAVVDSSDAVAARLAEAAATAGLRNEVLELGIRAHARVRAEGRTSSPILTVIDYSLPSREPRLWVLDLDKGAVLERELVAHGNGTGGDIATAFSNRPGSNQSSLGTFLTGKIYYGKHGKSLRLHGLDEGLNDLAFQRAIVVHGATYVNPGIVDQLGRLGRSQGCPALSPEASARIIELIRDGSVIFSYHPSAALETKLPA
ncbi:MAG TPA: murein L,D-transpeptidase catalytic domain family protein [Gemmatimonadales bacterium]